MCVSLTQINCDLYWSREAMKAICLCNYLSEGRLLLLGEDGVKGGGWGGVHTAYHHLIYKAQVLSVPRVHENIVYNEGETCIEAHYIHGIINSLFNKRV